VTPGPGACFDIERFLRQAGTLYLIAETRGDDSPVAPLFACLASEIHYTAALVGSRMPGGRLDPPLLMALDEVTQICPVPVPSWLADSGGKGIQIITVAHGEAQLRARWGSDGARIIADTSSAKIWLPGISDPAALETASLLCGTAAMREHGQDWTSRHPVMTPDMIRQLPATRALMIRGGCSPVIARLRMAWNDPVYQRARQARQAVAALDPAPEPEPEPRADRPRAWPGESMPGCIDLVAGADDPSGPVPGSGYPWDATSGLWPGYPWDDETGAA
jgi:type IV secretory pathway TraG/TraD family ATPase VirD4